MFLGSALYLGLGSLSSLVFGCFATVWRFELYSEVWPCCCLSVHGVNDFD